MPLLVLVLHLMALLCSPARAEEGVLKVRSNVATAEVFVDNVSVGVVPVTTYLAVGEHAIRVVADRYDPWVRRVKIESGKVTDAQANLTPGSGTVEWIGPAGARLKVDGADRGMLPIRLSDLKPGTHTWTVEAPRFEPAEGTVDFASGKNLLVNVAMGSSAGVVVVTSTPEGADVWLDGKPVGQTPLRLTGVAPGAHGVRLSADDRASVFRTIDTTDGARGEVTASLPASGASVRFPPLGSGSDLYVNGVLVGTGPDHGLDLLAKGRTDFRIVEGETVFEGEVTVPSSGRLVLVTRGRDIVAKKPLTEQWAFWAAVGGGVAAGATAGVVAAVAATPEPLPSGDIVVVLP